MKILDETGAIMENPDLTLGYLTDDTQPQQHRAARRLLCAHLAPRGLRKEVLNHEDH